MGRHSKSTITIPILFCYDFGLEGLRATRQTVCAFFVSSRSFLVCTRLFRLAVSSIFIRQLGEMPSSYAHDKDTRAFETIPIGVPDAGSTYADVSLCKAGWRC